MRVGEVLGSDLVAARGMDEGAGRRRRGRRVGVRMCYDPPGGIGEDLEDELRGKGGAFCVWVWDGEDFVEGEVGGVGGVFVILVMFYGVGLCIGLAAAPSACLVFWSG